MRGGNFIKSIIVFLLNNWGEGGVMIQLWECMIQVPRLQGLMRPMN